MCGIAGVVAPDPIDNLPALLDGFSRALEHRGPDDHGFLTWNGDRFVIGRDSAAVASGRAALIHRRLSIVDLSTRGWQPMIDLTRRYAIVLNGEIYNYVELRDELAGEGVEFQSHSDTEVLLHLLIRRGIDGLRDAVGMFAFAFCDWTRRRLWLARDPFGIKPLFYSRRSRQFAFASEIRPLIDLGFGTRRVEPRALFDYLRHAITDHAELTTISGVRQLLPAHSIEVDLDTCEPDSPRRYWTPRFSTRPPTTFDAAREQLTHLFTESVKLHLRSDVPVAATLSGGIDSSSIVATIERLKGRGAITVFSYIADDPAIGEEKFVDLAAGASGLTPRKIHLDPRQLADELDALILTQEQPFTTTSMWAQSCVFRRVHKDGFKVVMDGQGADELFAGYPVFRAARLATLIRCQDWGAAWAMLRSMGDSRAKPLSQALGILLPPRIRETARRVVFRPTMPSWLNASWFARHSAAAPRPFVDADAPTDLRGQLYDATVSSSLPMLLRYADRNAMAVSLENRVPFLTTAIAEFALSLPDAFLIGPDATTKHLLRMAMRGVVPDAIVSRRDKIGFATPEARWFAESNALRAQLAAAIREALPPCFAPDLVSRLRDVAEGHAPYSAEVWRCWNVIRWARLLELEFPS